jgi:hypothetical protein
MNFVDFFFILENFDLFLQFDWPMEMKSHLWLDNVETPNRPHEADAR